MTDVRTGLVPLVIPWQPWLAVICFGFSSITLSGFSHSTFAGLYLLLAPIFMGGCCVYAFLRAWRRAQARPSAKAATIIMGKRVFFSLALVSTLNVGISLLYALSTQRPFSSGYLSLLWLFGIFSIAILLLLISWLIRRYLLGQPQQALAQVQTLPCCRNGENAHNADVQDEREESTSGSGTRFWNTFIG